MTGTQLTAEVRRQVSGSSTSYSDAVLLPIVNFVKDQIASRITKKNENYFILPITFNLVTSDINAREYSLPTDILNNIDSLELAFDGTRSPLQYTTARKITRKQAENATDGLTEANIVNAFTNTDPCYIQYRNSIYILSGTITAVTAGAKLKYRAFPADLANLTGNAGLEIDPSNTTFGIPRVLHQAWARGVAIEVKQGKLKPVPLNELDKEWEKEVDMRIDELFDEDLSEETTGDLPATNREGNHGANL